MFSWGENVSGLVSCKGLELSETHVQFTLTKYFANKEVVAVIMNGNVSIARNQVDTIGTRQAGKLKRVVCKKRFQTMCCGDQNIILLSCQGALYKLNECSVPRLMDSFRKRATQVACGDQHYIVLTHDGMVYSWGQNSSGQLGNGNGLPSSKSPQPLKSLSGVPLAQISAGGEHSFALSLSGAVFGWGKNAAGQLGLGDTTNRYVPVHVDYLSLKKVILISCGEGHTAILTKGGTVLTFGKGSYGQLGHNCLRDELRPRLVAEFWGAKVTQIACGRNHTLALVGSSKKIYSFGHGEHGQLGNGSKTCQSVPLPVQLMQDGIDDQSIVQVFAGGNNSFAVCSLTQTEKEVYGPMSSATGSETLDDNRMDKWIAECNTKSWKKIEREITNIFSSVSSLNGSFLERSHDRHYQTSLVYSGLDLSLARLAFQKLASQERVITKVEAVVHHSLLPSLSKDPFGVEALRIYLILPELLRVLIKQNRGKDLAAAVASSILSLHHAKIKILEGLWQRMPYIFFLAVVKAFHVVTTQLFENGECDEMNWTTKVMSILYEVNCNRPVKIAAKTFHIGLIKEGFRNMLANRRFDIDLLAFLSCSCIFDFEAKCILLDFQCLKEESMLFFFPSSICVNRKTLLKDVFEYLREQRHVPRAPLQVTFLQEDGIDYGGVSQEFFTLLTKEILPATSEQKLLEMNEDSGLTWFTTHDPSVTDEFYLLGMISGMAVYNRHIFNLCFPLALFKKLLNLKPTLDDLKELSPTESRSLQNLLNEEEEVVEQMDLDFKVKEQELISNGAEVLVSKVNRQKYVDLYVDMMFNKSVECQFKKFAEGFLVGCPIPVWRIFLPEELMTLLQGDDKFEWEELKKNAVYQGYCPTDGIIQNFWTVFTEFSEDQKKSFLIFLTGRDRLPRGCRSRLRIKIKALFKDDPDKHYPEAETCFDVLQLPNYSSIDILREKLLHAITHCYVIGKH